MGQARYYQPAFNGGELSPMMDGRVDFGKYGSSCSILDNFIPTVSGPAYRRPGTRFVAEAAGSLAPVLVPFVRDRDSAYILAFGSTGITVYSDRGVVEASPGVPYVFGVGFSTDGEFLSPRRADGTSRICYAQTGDVMYIADKDGLLPLQKIKRLAHDSWTIERVVLSRPPFQDLPATGVKDQIRAHGWLPAGQSNRWLRIPTSVIPAADRAAWLGRRIQLWAEDVKYDVKSGAGPMSARVRDWTASLEIKPGLYDLNEWDHLRFGGRWYFIERIGFDGDIDDVTGTWSTHLTISEAPFHTQGRRTYASSNQEHPIRLTYAGNGYFNGKLTAVDGTDPSYTDFRVEWVEAGIPPEFTSTVWAWEAVWHGLTASGDIQPPGAVYPTQVAFFRERLVLANAQRVWFSVAGDYENFDTLDPSGNVVADMGASIEIAQGDGSPILWMVPTDRLMIGTASGEFAIGEQTDSDPFGPLNIKLEQTGRVGSNRTAPERVDGEVFFVQRSGRRLRKLAPGGEAEDLSILAEHLGGASPFVAMSWQNEPSRVLWVARQDGKLVGLTYNRSQEVVGWHRHTLGGVHAVRSVAVIPSPDGTWDDLWLSVERTITPTSGPPRSFFSVEVLIDERRLGRTTAEVSYLDCSLSYDGAASSTFSGLEHLDDATVGILADGYTVPDQDVIAGAVSLTTPASVVHVGLRYSSVMRSMRIEAGGEGGVAQGQIKRLHRVTLRLLETVGALVGPNLDKLDRIAFRRPSMLMNEAIPVATVDATAPNPSGYETDGYICVVQDQPLPMTLIALTVDLQTNPR